MRAHPFRTVLAAGAVAGTLDGTAAIVMQLIGGGSDPRRIFRFIATGVFGRDIPLEMWPWGVLFHYIIATGFATAFYLAWPALRRLRVPGALLGLLYGLVVWPIMNLVVLPLSRTRPIHQDLGDAAIGAAVLMVCVGLPIGYIVARGSE